MIEGADSVLAANKKPVKVSKKTKTTKKENTMKKSIIVAVISIVVTLALVASYAYTYQKGKSDQRTHDAKVAQEAKQLTAALKAE